MGCAPTLREWLDGVSDALCVSPPRLRVYRPYAYRGLPAFASLSMAGSEGRLEGEAAVLERQLTRRFGPLDEAARSRIRGASLDQLERWAVRLLDAPTLTAVFEEQ